MTIKQLPLTLALFTTTKGHFGRKTDWRLTLNHWDRQLPLSLLNLVAHIKVTVGEEALGDSMATELRGRGFHVVQTVGNWSRGLSHGAAYLSDQARLSREPKLHERPYMLLVEDDFLVHTHTVSLADLWAQSCQMLEADHELVTARVMRPADNRGPTVPHPQPDARYYWSEHTNFQPICLRTRDFYHLGMALEANPAACQQMHCEMLWRVILQNFSRSPHKHLVWEPTVAEAVHIGCPQEEHEQLARQYALT